MIKNKKILITGGSGFIGSNLAREILKSNNTVYIIDDLSTGNKNNLQFERNKNSKLIFIKSEITKYKKLKNIIKIVDIIFHLAASVGVKNIMKNPIYSISNNLNTSENIFRFASEFKKELFLHQAQKCMD